MTITHEASVARDARPLITADEFDGVTATVLDANPEMAQADAERIVEEALKFVAAAAARPGGMRPSRTVDEGWHALILHTRVYERLCTSLGRFVHHIPERPDPTRHDPSALDRTQANIVAAGFSVDRTLWLAPLKGMPVAAGCEHSQNCGDGECSGNCRDDHPN